jgi:hypothetical protein
LILLFSAILGSVFGIMGAFGGVLQVVERRVHVYRRKALRKKKIKNYLKVMTMFPKNGHLLPLQQEHLSNIKLGGEFAPFNIRLQA